MASQASPAAAASQEALDRVYECLRERRSFVLEAGAGAGKTYTLVEALRYLIENAEPTLRRAHGRIACITFTRVARDEIVERTDGNPLVFCETTHAFAWSLLAGFQKQMRAAVLDMPKWQEIAADKGPILNQAILYDLGYRSLDADTLTLHHDDVLPLFVALLDRPKFRQLVAQRFPFVLIDEYQDTDADLVAAIKAHFLGQPNAPLFGFFGDHWQKIYGDGCGLIDHECLELIGKGANFRSARRIVECLNRMRPDLVQQVRDPDDLGQVTVLHTNAWPGARRTGAHWAGDLAAEATKLALEATRARLLSAGWDLSEGKTKVLMLTHRVLAGEQGYPSLPGVFADNQAYAKKADRHIAYFVDTLEPACEAYAARRYGEMFSALALPLPGIKATADKLRWRSSLDKLLELRCNGTVGSVIDHLRETRLPRLPEAVEQKEKGLIQAITDGVELARSLSELRALRNVPYHEITALASYLRGLSPFETKHGVKGAQFENVLVVCSRGWSQYNDEELLEMAANSDAVPADRRRRFETNRNLFYVACSRPQKRLALLFTQRLSNAAMGTVATWFGEDCIEALPVPADADAPGMAIA